jgi:hypothetical protein
MAAGPGCPGAAVCEGDRPKGAAGPGAVGALGRWTVENCGGGGGGGAALAGAELGFPVAGGIGVGGGEAAGASGSCDPYRPSISAIAASSAVSSRVMSLSGNGGRKLLSCSSSAFRARL